MEGGGYQLAMELEANSAWRPWLGEQLYSEFRLHLGSPATWAAFMKPSEKNRVSPSHLRLQLKVRALLYDKALELPETPVPSSHLNPTYLQLKPDSVYFTLDQDALDWTRLLTEGSSSMAALQAKYGLDHRDTLSHHASEPMQQKLQSRKLPSITPKGRSGPGLRGPEQSKLFGRVPSESARNDPGDENSQECDLWYDQWFDKRLPERMHRLARRLAQLKLPFPEQEAFKRTPEGMASFVSSRSRARKRHQIYVGDHELEREPDFPEADLSILPELTTISNCVPDNPCPPTARCDGTDIKIEKISLAATGDSSPLSNVSLQLLSSGTGNKVIKISMEEADNLSRKAVGKILESQGFEGARQIPLDILTEVMALHIRKLGSWLRTLLDSYQKHLSPDELLRMFMPKLVSHRSDHSDSTVSSGNLRDLIEYVKNERSRHSQNLQTENTMQQYQQLQVHSRQFTALQQSMYLENILRKKQLTSLRGNKLREDLAGATAAYAAISKQPWAAQQIPHSQVLQQLKQQLQLPTIQQVSAKSGSRIEGLQEMLGNDVMKQETPDDLEGTLGSPNKRKRKDY